MQEIVSRLTPAKFFQQNLNIPHRLPIFKGRTEKPTESEYTMSKTAAITAAPIVAVNPLDPTGAIATAKAAVTVTGEGRARALRDAAEFAAGAAYGPFKIVSEYKTTDGIKFAAWISGARGHSGWAIEANFGKLVVGLTTLQSFIANGHVTNPEVVTAKVAAPTVKGILA